MANLKNITDLPVAESAEGLNLIVNDNGAAKQIAADSVCKVKSVNGAQPDESGNVQIDTASSWNDLKDKPFYTEMVEKTIECLENSVTDIVDLPVFSAGDAVTVKVNGEEYSLIAFDYNEMATIGDSWDDVDNGTGQFGWTIFVNGGALFYSKKACTVSLTAENVHYLDAKYLPVDDGYGAYDMILGCDLYMGHIEIVKGSVAALQKKVVTGRVPKILLRKHSPGAGICECPCGVSIDEDGAFVIGVFYYDCTDIEPCFARFRLTMDNEIHVEAYGSLNFEINGP